MPVVSGEIASDQTSHDICAVVQHIKNNIIRHRRKKDHGDTAYDSRNRKRKCDLEERAPLIRSQVHGSLDKRVIQFDDRIVNRQDHERQEIIHHTDHRVQERIISQISLNERQNFLECRDPQ